MGEKRFRGPPLTVLIYVEGQTEETFVRDVLAPYLLQRCYITLVPTLARTKRTKAGKTFKGGITSYRQVRGDILRLLQDTSASLVTTMIDFYGLPDDFPGKDSLPRGTPYERVQHLEQAFQQDIGNSRFLPYLVLHEFEAFVLVEPGHLAKVLPQHAGGLPRLQQDIAGLPPEEIDEGRRTHPAARIQRYFPGYRKALHGPRVVQRIGIPTLRSRCPHFNAWLKNLEKLCEETSP